jgi:hypothetical protein
MPCSTPTSTTTPAVVSASQNSPGLSWRMLPQAAQVREADGHGKHDGAQHASRQVLEWAGQKKEYQRNHRRRATCAIWL